MTTTHRALPYRLPAEVDVSGAGISFEPMMPEDVPAVMVIERRVFPSPWTAGMFLHELKLPFSRSRVARMTTEERPIVGYVCWWVLGDEAEILNVAVDPDQRRHGIGRALVDLVFDDTRAHGVSTLSLEVQQGNAAAIALYSSFGFRALRVRKHYYGRGEDAIVMICDLSRPEDAGC